MQGTKHTLATGRLWRNVVEYRPSGNFPEWLCQGRKRGRHEALVSPALIGLPALIDQEIHRGRSDDWPDRLFRNGSDGRHFGLRAVVAAPTGDGMRSLNQCRLYGILDTGYCAPDRMGGMLEAMIAGGVDLVQLRAKGMPADRVAELAKALHPVSQSAAVPLIINDHPALVAETGVEGAHIGVEDMSVAEARRWAGRDCWIGKSSHSLAQAREGAGQGADYLGFGPLFATPTKPDYVPIGTTEIREVYEQIEIPVFCIGGIKRENLPAVLACGARRVVIVSGILLAADPAEYALACRRHLAEAGFSG